jgi:hypothetical protein
MYFSVFVFHLSLSLSLSLFLETGSLYAGYPGTWNVAQAGLKLSILLP